MAFLRRQPGVQDAAWDACMGKLDIWPGHSSIGLRWHDGDPAGAGQVVLRERCWNVQEGIPGTITLFGWRPKVRKDRQQLKYLHASKCPGFVAQQRKHCEENIE